MVFLTYESDEELKMKNKGKGKIN